MSAGVRQSLILGSEAVLACCKELRTAVVTRGVRSAEAVASQAFRFPPRLDDSHPHRALRPDRGGALSLRTRAAVCAITLISANRVARRSSSNRSRHIATDVGETNMPDDKRPTGKLLDKNGYLLDKSGQPFTITDLGDLTQVVDHLKDPVFWNEEIEIEGNHPYTKQINFPFGLWFRGESRLYETPMLPGLFRSDFFYDESSMFNEFVMENSSKFGSSHFSTFEWLTLMQHHLLPTRLLDWTENPLVATYFGSGEAQEFDEQEPFTNLYILNALRLNQLSEKVSGIASPDQLGEHPSLNFVTDHKLFSTTEEDRIPIAVHAKRLNPRLHSQFGVFTLHSGKRVWKVGANAPKGVISATETFSKEYFLHNLVNQERPIITKVRISTAHKSKIRNQLEIFGVNESHIFPELEHKGRSIERKWRKKIN